MAGEAADALVGVDVEGVVGVDAGLLKRLRRAALPLLDADDAGLKDTDDAERIGPVCRGRGVAECVHGKETRRRRRRRRETHRFGDGFLKAEDAGLDVAAQLQRRGADGAGLLFGGRVAVVQVQRLLDVARRHCASTEATRLPFQRF